MPRELCVDLEGPILASEHSLRSVSPNYGRDSNPKKSRDAGVGASPFELCKSAGTGDLRCELKRNTQFKNVSILTDQIIEKEL